MLEFRYWKDKRAEQWRLGMRGNKCIMISHKLSASCNHLTFHDLGLVYRYFHIVELKEHNNEGS